MDASQDFKKTQEAISEALVKTTRSATRVAAEDVAFHRSLDPKVGPLIDKQNARLCSLAEKLIRRSAYGTDLDKKSAVKLSDSDAIDTNWRSIVDVVDSLLERVDRSLDEYNGLVKRTSPSSQPQSPAPRERPSRKSAAPRSSNLAKPQLHFEQKPYNYETEPFKPFLTSKPHAQMTLEQSLSTAQNEYGALQYEHPYKHEIEQYQYPSRVYTFAEPLPYKPFESTTATLVDDFEDVLAMVEELKGATEIAVDLEHHEYHSYIGVVSLMQISTRDRDWIVDTLKPWRRKLEVLNEVFADPNILKVLHGAHMDTIWLQRDLGIYVVGLFDTHHAARVLGYTGGSLAFLLKKFVNFDAQKQYQTADWRIRPLPEEMFDYARSDTHFLLHIYDCMRNDLIERSDFDVAEEDRVQAVLERSKETALLRYEHPFYNEETGLGKAGWFSLLQKTPSLLSKEQFAIFRKVHHWRDTVAREVDESPFYIMPNHVLFNIARSMPDSVASLLSVSHPISATMRGRTEELLNVVRAGRVNGINGPEVRDVLLKHLDPTYAPAIQAQSLMPAVQTHETFPDAQENRATTSQFWGSVLTPQIETKRTHIQLPNHAQFALPFLEGAVEGVTSFEADARDGIGKGNASTSQTHLDRHPPEPTYAENPSKRKRSSTASSPANSSPSGTSPKTAPTPADDANEQAATAERIRVRAERKAEKAAAKAAKKKARHGVNGGGDAEGDEEAEAFDYDAAPSVLHAPRDVQKEKEAKARSFNPYAKAADAPAGLKRRREPQGGKSATWKQ